MDDLNLSGIKPETRTLNDMRNVLFDSAWAEKQTDCDLYYMYRGVREINDLRYDITVMPAKMLGKEYLKTKGHEHCVGHSELYKVLEGEAMFLSQKGKDEIEDVVAINASQGDIVVVPRGGYSHITINPSETDTLKIANWVSLDCESNYDFIESKKGACYFYTIDGWIKNPNYKTVPELRFENPLKEFPEHLSFLKEN
ncbi:MAG: glucose-6-phosphate isomerase family protein [Candidatus Pacebacteria bacterium]|nr:glucose-6-phosphate isomerase family protein [Candidatus Paceibacterota bacterium]